MKRLLILPIIFLCGLFTLHGQTFFEAADGTGNIYFSSETVSQLKVNISSTAISFGLNHVSKKAKGEKKGFLFNADIKAKPNTEGVATLVNTGNFQPGVSISAAPGIRLNGIHSGFSVIDFYLKPSLSYDAYAMFDTTRVLSGEEAFYKTNRTSFDVNLIVNYGASLFKSMNLFIGLQYGRRQVHNATDFPKVTLQTAMLYPGSTNRYVFSDIEEARMGKLERVTKYPFSADLLFDPGLKLGNDESNTKLAVFGYFRTDGKADKQRTGFGLCLTDKENPSKIFTSFGYELPVMGSDVKEEDRKKDEGKVFLTIGYTIK